MTEYFIDLTGQEPLAEGKEQWVFAHPDDADRVVKVLKPWPKPPRLRRPQVKRFQRQRVWFREISEYIAATGHTGGHVDRLALQFGFCDTSAGFGMVMERINGPDGNLAPTLADALAANRHNPDYLRLLKEDTIDLFDTLLATRVDWHDHTVRNSVVGGTDKPHLVVIDGLGASMLFAMTQFSDYVFRYVHGKHRAKVLSRIDEKLEKAIARAARRQRKMARKAAQN